MSQVSHSDCISDRIPQCARETTQWTPIVDRLGSGNKVVSVTCYLMLPLFLLVLDEHAQQTKLVAAVTWD